MTKQEVSDLLEKNKNSLLKEIQESKELVVLLKESATRKLNEEEKSKVKEQLLDICKSIPAFAVFMLPGGALLLPLLIKFIPKLLPSAFRE
jgi:Mg2+/Co2+ transporter CorC|tara:strand:- start:1284 stop:1556 length:273 start_codon:yes stop_codon:yes gene_type:complete